jgi:hypothetical protein
MVHPGHVIQTILRRFEMILGGPETLGTFTSQLVLLSYGAMAFVTPVVLVQLLRTRRTADAFLIAWPMFYALASLGVLYVERRYVRYAGLTYLLALPIALKMTLEMPLPQWSRRWWCPELRVLKLAAGAVALTILVSGVGLQILSMRALAGAALANRLDATVPQPPTLGLSDINFRPVIPAAAYSRNSSGLTLHASAPAGTYLLMAPMESRVNAAAVVRYRVKLKQGQAIGLGILSADKSHWLSHQITSGAAGATLEGTLVSSAEVGSNFVIDAQDASGETNADFARLEWTFTCIKAANLLRIFFKKEKVQAETCSATSA